MLVANDIRAAALRTVATPSKAARMRIELKRWFIQLFRMRASPLVMTTAPMTLSTLNLWTS